ncbi:MAG: trypsin-like peptidase domain-containing protein [Ignavibacteria bacterium]|nr:trypsin-like peptidase domain-containing protein [Ignavibacteria bacterium]
MKKIFPLKIFILLLVSRFCFSQTYEAESIYSLYNDAVVVVIACDSYGTPVAQGSGVVIDDNGTIVTNYHVLSSYTNIKIKHNETLIEDCQITGKHKNSDIAFLKVSPGIFKSIPLGSNDEVKIGQKIYALGSPLGFENSITEGIVNGIRKISHYSDDNYIQISASISHGSSGGALINTSGKLIGITTSTIEEGQNINFAIPVDKIISLQYSVASDDNYFNSDKNTKTKRKDNNDYSSGDENTRSQKDTYKKDRSGNADKNDKEGRASVPDNQRSGKNNRSNGEDYYNYAFKGNDAYESGQYSLALEYYTLYLEQYPDDNNIQFNVGLCYLAMEEDNKALKIFLNVVKSDPYNANIYCCIGDAKRHLGYYSQAVDYYKTAIKLDATHENAYYGMGLAYYFAEDYPQAAICFTANIMLDDSEGIYYFLRAKCYINGDMVSSILNPCADLRKAYNLGYEKAASLYNSYCR